MDNKGREPGAIDRVHCTIYSRLTLCVNNEIRGEINELMRHWKLYGAEKMNIGDVAKVMKRFLAKSGRNQHIE
ncbi:unnamed protein product [Cercopithifilaria johnstoni]|uniref:Uncharacterized protein n=1 Tax=Cercopithifilaria johnstoni TaxID=2874296 RepID=A0A8J2Q174_9BILA|nr:unnamed protein product [Cercopithifilaria johnstoni]